MAPNDLVEYFRVQTKERSVRAIAMRAGLDPSTLNRQLNGTTALTVETVVAIARAYKLDFADAFVAVGFITAEEARSFGSRHGLSEFADQDLTREVVRRLHDGTASADITDPVAPEIIRQVVEERATTGHDDVPYIGRIAEEDVPDRKAADTRKKKSDMPHAE